MLIVLVVTAWSPAKTAAHAMIVLAVRTALVARTASAAKTARTAKIVAAARTAKTARTAKIKQAWLDNTVLSRSLVLALLFTLANPFGDFTEGKRAPEAGIVFEGVVARVRDGDTPVVRVQVTLDLPIRMVECWVPDERPIISSRAKRDLEEYALGQPVVVQIAASTNLRDLVSFERLVGEVWLKNARESLSEWQVSKGNASTTRQGKLGE